MSLPARTYYCSKCDFSQPTVLLGGAREYVFPDGSRLPVKSRLGWCEDCCGLATVEEFAERDISADGLKSDQELPLLPIRPPRCLTCGSTRVLALLMTNQEPWVDVKKPYPTGSFHPGCGGEVWLRENDGLRFILTASIRLYTLNGEFIEQVFPD